MARPQYIDKHSVCISHDSPYCLTNVCVDRRSKPQQLMLLLVARPLHQLFTVNCRLMIFNNLGNGNDKRIMSISLGTLYVTKKSQIIKTNNKTINISQNRWLCYPKKKKKNIVKMTEIRFFFNEIKMDFLIYRHNLNLLNIRNYTTNSEYNSIRSNELDSEHTFVWNSDVAQK